ncbi:glycosyltransferase family 1 protein [Sphingomonas humi]|uniref:Glycosyl transferase family 1 domain-containing protein n=1 Tax=Sphingomonas humi TaxID=335630 RepID=A0ABP7S2V4_9SPHN
MRALATFGHFIARQIWLATHQRKAVKLADVALPRLLVDVSTIIRHDAQTGIQRVVRGVWTELLKRHGKEFELVPVQATRSRGYCYVPLEGMEFGKDEDAEVPVIARAGDRFLGLDFSAHFLPKYTRQLKAWRDAGASIHLVVYDLLPVQHPEWFTQPGQTHYRRWLSVLIEQADQAICISKQVAHDLGELFYQRRPVRCPAITTMRLGGDIAASRPSAGICGEVAALLDRFTFRPAVLMVGTVEPRKGYDVALAAFEHLWATRGGEAPDLVIVGKPGWKTGPLQRRLRTHPEYGKRLHWLTGVTDEGLCELYAVCRGLLMASRGEGMGLPLLEAASHRRPLLVRDLPVFREQQLAGVQYFEDDSPEALAGPLLRLATDRDPLPVQRALPTWGDSVTDLLAKLTLPDGASTTDIGDVGEQRRARA